VCSETFHLRETTMPRTAFKVDLSRPPEAAEIKTHKTGRSRELMKPKISLRTTDRESRYASVASSAIIEIATADAGTLPLQRQARPILQPWM
jgi:hypothetical protein